MAAQPRYPEVVREPRIHRNPGNCEVLFDIDLAGVPAIPDAAHSFIAGSSGTGNAVQDLPSGLAVRTERSIREACEEIQRRRFAAIPPYIPPVEEADDYDD